MKADGGSSTIWRRDSPRRKKLRQGPKADEGEALVSVKTAGRAILRAEILGIRSSALPTPTIPIRARSPTMETYDIIMLAVAACATFFGFIKGFAWQLASLASLV